MWEQRRKLLSLHAFKNLNGVVWPITRAGTKPIGPCKGIQDSLSLDSGFHAVDSGFQLVDSGFFVSGTLDSGFQSLVRFQIPQAEYIQDSGFHKQNFPDSGKIPLRGESLKLFIQLRGSFPLSYLYPRRSSKYFMSFHTFPFISVISTIEYKISRTHSGLLSSRLD